MAYADYKRDLMPASITEELVIRQPTPPTLGVLSALPQPSRSPTDPSV
jgi:hypothetical protein